MNRLTIALFFVAVFFTLESRAQSATEDSKPKNSFIVEVDALEIDIYNNHESDRPPLDINNLKEPTLFILDEQALSISKFAELKLEDEKIESIIVTQNPAEIKRLGYDKFNSVVRVKTKEKE